MKNLKTQLKINNCKNGYIAITVLILMMVLVSVVYLFSNAVFSELAIARNNKGAQISFSLAEAGVQEAIYRVQHDSTTRNNFINTTSGVSNFSHNPALVNNGAYSVTIQNTSRGVATVTSVGTYTMGLKTARREIKLDIAQAIQLIYPYDGAIYASGSGAGSSIADIDIWGASLNIYGGSLLANRDINLKFGANVNIEKAVEAGDDVVMQMASSLDCNCLINDDGDPLTPQCSPSPGCTPLEGALPKTMPQIDFEAYKTVAKNTPGESPTGSQYFANANDFLNLVPIGGSKTFNGVVYVDDNLDINFGRTINMNGVLAASQTIDIIWGQVNMAPPSGGGASGIFTQKNLKLWGLGNFDGTGLIYAGDRLETLFSVGLTTNLTGGIIARRTWVNGFRTINIYFDSAVINTALGDPTDTPVIELNHWEEEY
ncbi:MAG: hypothetical protein WCV58_03065 [Patescibacteria group bacterium]